MGSLEARNGKGRDDNNEFTKGHQNHTLIEELISICSLKQ